MITSCARCLNQNLVNTLKNIVKSMSSLLLVGMLVTVLANVSHVCLGSANSPVNPGDINSLAYHSGNPKDFWWMADDSPLKEAFAFYKDCSSKGNCLTQPGSNIDDIGAIDLSKNPFLNGAGKGKDVPSSFTGNGKKVHDENGFLGVQPKKPGFPTTHPLSNKKPFPTSPPIGQQSFVLGENNDRVDEIKCNGEDRVCLSRELCNNGVVNRKLIREKSHINVCNGDNEVCCKITENEISHKFDITSSNDATKGIASSINQLIQGEDTLISASEFPSSSAKPTRSINSAFGVTPDYSDVQFDSNVRFASTIQGPGYLPPLAETSPEISTYKPIVPTTRPPVECPLGSHLTESGLCEAIQIPPCPFGTIRKIDGTCGNLERPCPAGTYRGSSGQCESPTTPSCPYGTIKQIDGSCKKLEPVTPQTCPFGSYRSGQCIIPTTPEPCPFGTIKQIDGSCKKQEVQCPLGTSKSASGQCITSTCPFGTIKQIDGSCKRLEPSTPRPCPAGTYKSTSGECIIPQPPKQLCPYGTIEQIDGSCQKQEVQCPPGTSKSASGQCISIACPFGTIKQIDGSCKRLEPSTPRPCPAGTYSSTSGECIIPKPPKQLCPYGTIEQIDGSCKKQEVQCPPGTSKSASGQCISIACPFGTIKQIDGSCRKQEIITTRPCPIGTYKSFSGECITPSTPAPRCPFGTYKQPDGSCRELKVPPKRTCPFGTIEQIDGSCKKQDVISSPRPCGPGTFLGSSGQCQPSGNEYTIVCPPGTSQATSGQCITDICPFGTIKQTDGSCKRQEVVTTRPCPVGTYKSFSGECVTPSTPPPGCPFGTYKQPDGSCGKIKLPSTPRPCGPGTFLSSSGICEAFETPRPCPPGTYKSFSGQCISVSTPAPAKLCPFGTIKQIDGNCREIESPLPRPCPPGTYKNSLGKCITPPNYEPNKACPFGTVKQLDGSCRNLNIVTPRPCPPGAYKSTSGECITPSTPTPPPSCPFGTIEQVDGTCKTSTSPGYEYPKPCPFGEIKGSSGECIKQCPFGTIRQFDGSCRRPEPITPAPCPPGTFRAETGQCLTQTPQTCPFGTIRQPDNSCLKPTTSRDYLPPTTTTRPNQPGGYHYDKPTPTFAYPSTTLIPSQNNINTYYVSAPTEASTEDNVPDYANDNKFFISPTTPEHESPAVGCAAALKCVQEIYCTADGFVSPVPVVLTPQQELLRAPTTVCKDLESGITGKCCRDANYKDPWPSANLVNGVDDGQYKEDNFYGQREISSNRLVRASNDTRPALRSTRRSEKYETEAKCGARNLNTKPRGESAIDANFSEFPWQAMILRDSNRSLLCGGAIIRTNAVLTTAHCVEGLETSDILIKGGEWKLGIDEEPLPYQIVKVAAIVRHPEYKASSYVNDMAVLVLQEKLRVAKNIGTICLPQPNQIPTENCKATGWGKRILQLHAKGALMHHIDVKIMDNKQCQGKLSEQFKDFEQNYSPNTLCGLSDIDQCKVDYGSALACANEQGQYTLSGIYSWDTGCKQEGQIGGYVAPDVEWIEKTLRKSRKELRQLDREYLLKTKSSK